MGDAKLTRINVLFDCDETLRLYDGRINRWGWKYYNQKFDCRSFVYEVKLILGFVDLTRNLTFCRFCSRYSLLVRGKGKNLFCCPKMQKVFMLF